MAEKEVSDMADKELVTVERAALPVDFKQQRELMVELEKFIRDLLKEKTDFGTIPGTNKPTLYKAGAEKLCGAFNLAPRYTILDQTVEPDKPFYRYQVRCNLVNRRTGETWADCIGECISTEPGRQKAPSNTILKMAQKRAYVGATLHATFTSDRFTADMDTYGHGSNEESGSESTVGPSGGISGNGYEPEQLLGWSKKYAETPISKIPFNFWKWVIDTAAKPDSKIPDKILSIAKAEIKHKEKKRKGGQETESEALDLNQVPPDQLIKHIVDILEPAYIKKQKTDKDEPKVPDMRKAAIGMLDLEQASLNDLQNYAQLLKEQS